MVADQDVLRLASLAANQPWVKTTALAEDIFRSDVDGVVIATPVRTHFQLAKAYIATHHLQAAFKEVQTTVDLDPGNVEAQLQYASMLLIGKNYDEAQAVVAKILASCSPLIRYSNATTIHDTKIALPPTNGVQLKIAEIFAPGAIEDAAST